MKDPHQFPRVLTGVMVGVMFLFAGAGALAYAAYGSAIQVRRRSSSRPCADHTTVADCRLRQPPSRRPLRQRRPIPLLDRHPPLDSAAAFPRRANYGERGLLAVGQAFEQGQVGEEPLPHGRRRCVQWYRVGGRQRSGQVC